MRQPEPWEESPRSAGCGRAIRSRIEGQPDSAGRGPNPRTLSMSKRMMLIAGAVVLVVGGLIAWMVLRKPDLPPGFAGGNGRLEAQVVYIASKYPGRIAEVGFRE